MGAAETGADYALLSLLLDAGADVSQCDTYGKDIFHYLAELGDETLSNWLKQPKENSQ
jgi:ankyrin repeat protein